eukprot:GHRQ01022440.1.p5 GENE.GHRQ01022440.1~~GHRQ01022440.1.p5  ORF type:complete len:123 (-),score=30.80 GHRQ01022440.1:1082-1450(-)
MMKGRDYYSLHVCVLQVLAASFVSGPASLTPSLVAAAAAALWLKQKQVQSVQELRKGIAQLPGLCATAMFALAPIPQLVSTPTMCWSASAVACRLQLQVALQVRAQQQCSAAVFLGSGVIKL